jgi:hypothetical protein
MTRLPIAIAAAVLATSNIASARDSMWLVCKGIVDPGAGHDKSYLVASLYEHRSESGASRDLAVTVIYGDHVAKGAILDSADGFTDGKARPVKLATVGVKTSHPIFTGTLALTSDVKSVSLVGSLDAYYGDAAKPSLEQVTAKLVCQQLDDMAIGH